MNAPVKKLFFSLWLLRIATAGAQSFPPALDYYGMLSADADSSMVSMTDDLYLTQLSDMSDGSVSDLRSPQFTAEYFSTGEAPLSGTGTAFYGVLAKAAHGKWKCTLYLITPASARSAAFEKEFDSYYKIMTDAKPTIQAAFSYFAHPLPQTADAPLAAVSAETVSTETIAGTWDGEQFIDKIIILRGGRGFIIYKNGATMEISIAVTENDGTVRITQSGKSNASYFPDLPREVALTLATSAEPLSWSLALTDNNTLSGTKSTFKLSGGGAVPAIANVIWKRRL